MNFVTDRTESDVLLNNEKGRYKYSDLNRVERAVSELCQLAQKLDMYPELTTKTNWSRPGTFSAKTWPTESQMQRYIQNVHRLCDCFGLSLPLPATMDQLNWEGANNIEKALQYAYVRVQSILNTFYYSGELFAGEENVL